MDNLHYLLKHPVLMAFLELELNSLRLTYFFDFLVYLVFVVILPSNQWPVKWFMIKGESWFDQGSRKMQPESELPAERTQSFLSLLANVLIQI